MTHELTDADGSARDMRRRTQYDELTELANRHGFYDHLQRAISAAKRRPASRYAVLLIDVDNFKSVNEEFGHSVADELLAATARRLEYCVRLEDVVARIGSDEFAILLNGIDCVSDASDAAHRIGVVMREPIAVDERNIPTTLSIGIALGNQAHNRPDDLLRDADAAMHCAKTEGRARSVRYDTAAGDQSETPDLAADLRRAIESGELRTAFQPIMHLSDKRIAGFEALVRWQHPRLGLLQPSHFIAKAQESDLIVAIDRWVLRESCSQRAKWQTAGIVGSQFKISVNVSGKSLSRMDFLDELRESLALAAIAPASLRLEITEAAIMERSERVNALITSIRALGVDVDVDHFGTGRFSLNALHDMCLDALKIDCSFIAHMESRNGVELIRTIITLAHNLGMAAIAEGIETQEHLDRLTELGCDFGQGLFFACALDGNAAVRFLRESGYRCGWDGGSSALKRAPVPASQARGR